MSAYQSIQHGMYKIAVYANLEHSTRKRKLRFEYNFVTLEKNISINNNLLSSDSLTKCLAAKKMNTKAIEQLIHDVHTGSASTNEDIHTIKVRGQTAET